MTHVDGAALAQHWQSYKPEVSGPLKMAGKEPVTARALASIKPIAKRAKTQCTKESLTTGFNNLW